MPRLTRVLLSVSAVLLIVAPVAHARATRLQTLRFRVPVPVARDVSVLAFELRIGGEGKHHRKQRLTLHLVNHREPGVFALARLRPERGHPGRFLGVVEVFHRGSTTTAALPSGLGALSRASPFAPAHAAAGFYDEFSVRAENERLIKEVIKANIVDLAEEHELGPDEFCNPLSPDTYLLGGELVEAAYVQAGLVKALPTNTTVRQLLHDAEFELCEEVEEELGTDRIAVQERSGIEVLRGYLGRTGGKPTPPTAYKVGFTGAWAFEGTVEVKLVGMLTGAWAGPLSRAADSTNPVDAIKVVLPPAGSTPRQVTNYICPSQLPTAAITTTTNANDTLACSGGSLALNQQFSLNVQSAPPPSSGMGGQLLAHQDGAYLAPFSFGGP
jgi:hypothetical protein